MCLRPHSDRKGTVMREKPRTKSWAQPFPRTWMLRPSGHILRGPNGFRQLIAMSRQFRILGEGLTRLEQYLHSGPPGSLHPSPQNLAHLKSVHETWNTRHDHNCLNRLNITLVSSLRNLDNRHRLKPSDFTGPGRQSSPPTESMVCGFLPHAVWCWLHYCGGAQLVMRRVSRNTVLC